MSPLGFLITIVAILSFGVAGFFFVCTLEEVRPRLPLQFREEVRARFALDSFVWQRSVPPSARRNYMLSLSFSTFAVGCLATVMALNGPIYGTALFAGLFLFFLYFTLARWMKYRGRVS
ncbi:MAG: hypothetical protein ACJ8EU_14200 [Xanthobacteraceae bacterium]